MADIIEENLENKLRFKYYSAAKYFLLCASYLCSLQNKQNHYILILSGFIECAYFVLLKIPAFSGIS